MMEEVLPRSWVTRVLPAEFLNLLLQTVVGVCLEAHHQMALPNELEKDVASLNDTLLHVVTVLQSVHLLDTTDMVEEIFMKGPKIGIRVREVILIALHADITEAHQEAGVPPDTNEEAAEVGAFLAVQMVIVVVTGMIARAGVLVREISVLPLVRG